jgi:potassium-dependent mechanosensitive channel
LLLKDERDALPAFEEQLDRLQSERQAEVPLNQRRTFHETVATIRSDRREYLQALISDYESQVANLSNYNFAAGRLLDSRNDFAAFIGEHVLWIRSAAPLTSRQELAGATDAMAYLLSPTNFTSLFRQVTATSKTRPFEAVSLLIVFAVALAYGRRFRKQLIESARLSSAQDSLHTAFRAVGFSLVAACVWPLLIGMAAWRIGSLDDATPWSTEFASALTSVAVLLLTAGVIRQLCRENGAGELIFGWDRRVTNAIRKSIASAVFLGCPLAFGVSFLESHGDKVWIDSLSGSIRSDARCSSVGCCCCRLSPTAYCTLATASSALSSTRQRRSDGCQSSSICSVWRARLR